MYHSIKKGRKIGEELGWSSCAELPGRYISKKQCSKINNQKIRNWNSEIENQETKRK